MTDDDYTPHGFEIRTDTEAEKMTVQVRLRDSGAGWHTMSRLDTSLLVDHLDKAVWDLRRAENERRMNSAKRTRYRELLKAHAHAPLDAADLEELRELHSLGRCAGLNMIDEVAALCEPRSGEEAHGGR